MKIYYNPKLKAYARKLRNNSTLAEVLLWNKLKARKMRGHQFMRQKPINQYIVDFYCSKLKGVIEIDGETHIYKGEKDMMKQQVLESLGLTVLRFNDELVKKERNHVVSCIETWIDNFENTTP